MSKGRQDIWYQLEHDGQDIDQSQVYEYDINGLFQVDWVMKVHIFNLKRTEFLMSPIQILDMKKNSKIAWLPSILLILFYGFH